MSTNDIFEVLDEEDSGTEALSGEELLMVAVIKSAVAERDYEYFNGDTFEYHCAILGVDTDVMRSACHRHMGGH